MKFIAFEGGEGSGKTTLIKKLSSHYQGLGLRVLETKEPGGTEIGLKFREILLHFDLDPMSELFLFLAGRKEHLNWIQNQDFDLVLCDRFYGSTYAYQIGARGLEKDFVRDLNLKILNGFDADLTLFLDIEPEVCFERQKNKNRFELEGLEFHKRVYSSYLSLASEFSWKKINARNSPKSVFEESIRMIDLSFNSFLN